VTLDRSFYDRPTLDVAKDLLGKVLVHRRRGSITSGLIVEVEAYIGESDPASHAAPGPTVRNQPMYGLPGFSYVYLNYGIHCMMNIVTESHGHPAAVLVRALEPLDGIGVMRRRRLREMKGRRTPAASELDVNHLCRGPGNLTMAMGITLGENRVDLVSDRLFIEDRGLSPGRIAWGPRIGIRVGIDRLWRAYVSGNASVSALKMVRA
jgi:DNA-3-methyladenine glycosylase